MSDDDSNRSAAGEPFAWAFYQQLPGRLGSVVLCTVRSREEADDLRAQGIDIFPLYSEAALRRPPAPAPPETESRGLPWPTLDSAPAFGREPAERQGKAGSQPDPRPPLPQDIFGLPSGAEYPPPGDDAPWSFSARARAGGTRDSSPPPAANTPVPGSPEIPANHRSLIREVLQPFAQMAALVEDQDEDETVLSLQAGPLQWRHLTVGDLRRARSLYLASEG